MEFRQWYDALNKPSWTPDPSLIGTVWTVLYPVIFAVNIYMWSKFLHKEISAWILAPFVINIVANFAFTPVQFGLRNLDLASVIIVIILLTIVWSMVAVWPINRLVTAALAPYLIWVAIASVLQISISSRN